MFDIKDGKVIATFPGDKVESLSLDDVKLDLRELALIALQRVSRETIAGLATDEPEKAREKMLKRWQLWKGGKWETSRIATPKLTEAEIAELIWSVFEFQLTVAKVKDGKAMLKRAKEAVNSNEPEALAKFETFKKNNAKAIKQRIKEAVNAKKNAADLTY